MERDEEPLSILDIELGKFILENDKEEPIIVVNNFIMSYMMTTPNLIAYDGKKITYKYRNIETVLDKKMALDKDYEIMTMKEYKRRGKCEKEE